MTERLLRIRMRAIGQETVTRAVRGITNSARAAARAQERSSREAARAQISAERQTTREAQTSARTRERAAQQEARGRTRAAQQAARERLRVEAAAARDEQRMARQVTQDLARESRARVRAEERAQREIARGRRRGLAMAGAVGGALLGGARAVYGRVQGYQAAVGMPTRDELVGNFIERQRQTIRLAHQGGVDSGQLSQRIDSTAQRSGVSQGELLGGLQFAQSSLATPDFNALDVFSRHLDEIADASYATGAPVEDLIGALGQMRNQFGITEDDFTNMIGTIVAAANAGSIEVGDLASNFPREMAQFRGMRSGVSGMEAAREFVGTAEAIGADSPNDPEGASTRFRAVMGALGHRSTRRGLERQLRRGGLSREESDVFDDRTGQLTVSMPELVSRMRRGHIDNPEAFERAGIHETRAQQGFRSLLNTSDERFSELVNASSEQGNEMIRSTNNELRGSAAGRADQARANAEANFQQNGGAVVDQMVALAAAATDLETRFPKLTEAMGALSDVMSGMGLGSIVGGAVTGGGVSSLVGGGGAAAAGGGLGLGGLGMLGLGGVALAGQQALVGGLQTGVFDAIDNPKFQAMRDTNDAWLREQAPMLGQASDWLNANAPMLNPLGAHVAAADAQRHTAEKQRLDPADIRSLADAVGRAVADHAPEPTPPSSLSGNGNHRRIPAEHR